MQVVLTGAFREKWAMSVQVQGPFYLWAGQCLLLTAVSFLFLRQICFCKIAFFNCFSLLHLVSFLSVYLCHACNSSLRMRTIELFSLGVYAAQEPEQSGCLLLRLQWTKPGTQTHKRLLKSLEKINPFTKMPFILVCSSPAVERTLLQHTHTQTDVHWKDTQDTLSHLTFRTVFLLFTQAVFLSLSCTWCLHQALVV